MGFQVDNGERGAFFFLIEMVGVGKRVWSASLERGIGVVANQLRAGLVFSILMIQ